MHDSIGLRPFLSLSSSVGFLPSDFESRCCTWLQRLISRWASSPYRLHIILAMSIFLPSDRWLIFRIAKGNGVLCRIDIGNFCMFWAMVQRRILFCISSISYRSGMMLEYDSLGVPWFFWGKLGRLWMLLLSQWHIQWGRLMGISKPDVQFLCIICRSPIVRVLALLWRLVLLAFSSLCAFWVLLPLAQPPAGWLSAQSDRVLHHVISSVRSFGCRSCWFFLPLYSVVYRSNRSESNFVHF